MDMKRTNDHTTVDAPIERAFFDPKLVAHYLGFSRWAIYRLVSDGKLKSVPFGSQRIRIGRSELDRFVAEGGGRARGRLARLVRGRFNEITERRTAKESWDEIRAALDELLRAAGLGDIDAGAVARTYSVECRWRKSPAHEAMARWASDNYQVVKDLLDEGYDWEEIMAVVDSDIKLTRSWLARARLVGEFEATERLRSADTTKGLAPVPEGSADDAVLDEDVEEQPTTAKTRSYGQVARLVEKHFDEIAAWRSAGVFWREIAKRLDDDGEPNANGVKWAFGHAKRSRYQHSDARIAKLMWLQAYQAEIQAFLEQGCEWFFVLKILGYPLDGENIDRLVTELEGEFRAMGERAACLKRGARP